MSRQLWDDVDRYIAGHLIGDDHAIDTEGLPQIEVTAPQGKLLMLLARMVGARRILEFGTLGGYSTLWLAKALPPDGQLVTLEAHPGHAEVARRNLAGDGRIRLVEGPALETVRTLEGPFDLIFIDADKVNQANYLRESLPLARPGTLIVGDNVVRDGRVLDPASDDPSIHGVREFFELMAAEPRLTATAIQTVGTKGHDGLAFALVS